MCNIKQQLKGNALHVTGRGSSHNCDTSRFPHFLYNRLTDGIDIVRHTLRAPLTPPPPPGRFLVLISVRGCVDPTAIVRLEVLGQFEKNNDLVGNRPCDLPPCSILPQPTTLLRVPLKQQLVQLIRISLGFI
jgi:hypothetical protein